MAQFDINDEDIDNDEKLDQDYDTPFSEPGGVPGRIPVDHPSTDTGLDEHELYDEGLSGAAEVEEPEEDEIL